MSQIRGAWVPESPEEDELLMDLHEATRKAHEAGVDINDIVGGMNYLSAAIAVHGDEMPQMEDAPEPEPEKREDCPDCGGEISRVIFGMGREAEVQPCGCSVSIDEIPKWVNQ